MGIRSNVSRSTLAEASENRDWLIYADFAHHPIGIASKLYLDETTVLDLDQTVYALDATTIDLCLSVFPWAAFRRTKGALKLHTLLDLRGHIPTFIYISYGKLHKVDVLDIISLEPGAFYIMDRGYTEFLRLYAITQGSAFFVIRAKSNLNARRLYSHTIDRNTGLVYDQSILLSGYYASRDYKVSRQKERQDLGVSGQQLCFARSYYRGALQAEMADRALLQMNQAESSHQTLLRHFGKCRQSANMDCSICLSACGHYPKKLNIQASLYTILQALSVSTFERTMLNQLLTFYDYTT